MSQDSAVRLMMFEGATRTSEEVEQWFDQVAPPLGAIARRWFDEMRACGPDVTVLLHDGQPTACVHGAAFGYVDAFTSHVNVGFFLGAHLFDPSGLLAGTGRYMRHVKVRPGVPVRDHDLSALISRAYEDMSTRLAKRGGTTAPPRREARP